VHQEEPIHYSNVMLIDSDKNATRVGVRVSDKLNSKGKPIKVRYAKTNGKDI